MQFLFVFFHVLAGSIALAGGFLALYSQKGRTVHRRAGRVFAYAMLAMTATGTVMALGLRPNRPTVIAGLVTFYLVATGLLTVIRHVRDTPTLHKGLLGLGLLAAAAAWTLGVVALGMPGGKLDHIPAPMLFLFATVATFGVIGDARLLRAGAIEGAARLRRHLWRMNFAMWVATTSFFFGQARQLPQWFRDANLNDYLVLGVTLTFVYWLFQLRGRRRASAPVLGATAAHLE